MSVGASCLIHVAIAASEVISFINCKIPPRQWPAMIPLLTGGPQKDSWMLWMEGERSHPFTVSAKEVEWRGTWALWGSERVRKEPGKGLVFRPH